MFAYCQNNPVKFIDPDGLCREVGPLISAIIDCMSIYCPTSKVYRSQCNPNVMELWYEDGVSYKSNGNGNGGKIENSYLITDHNDIYEYAYYLVVKSEFSNDFAGTVAGVVYEWELHNDIYYNGPQFLEEKAKSVDLGATIYDDSHHGLEYIMWFGYTMNYPIESMFDHIIYQARQ